MGIGLESALEPPGHVYQEWPISNRYWRGGAKPDDTVRKYMELCATPLSLEFQIRRRLRWPISRRLYEITFGLYGSTRGYDS